MGQFVTTVTKCPLLGQSCKSVYAQNQIFQKTSCGQNIHTKYHTFRLNTV